ncbi:hypothetical protein THOM_2875, partial [Trachipleistophora hominis]
VLSAPEERVWWVKNCEMLIKPTFNEKNVIFITPRTTDETSQVSRTKIAAENKLLGMARHRHKK